MATGVWIRGHFVRYERVQLLRRAGIRTLHLPLATRIPRCVATKPRLDPPKQPASKSEVALGVRIAAMVAGTDLPLAYPANNPYDPLPRGPLSDEVVAVCRADAADLVALGCVGVPTFPDVAVILVIDGGAEFDAPLAIELFAVVDVGAHRLSLLRFIGFCDRTQRQIIGVYVVLGRANIYVIVRPHLNERLTLDGLMETASEYGFAGISLADLVALGQRGPDAAA